MISRETVLHWLSVAVLFGASTYFGVLEKNGAMALSVLAGALGIAFANLDKFTKIKGAGFEAEIRERVVKVEQKASEVETLVQPVIDKETEPQESTIEHPKEAVFEKIDEEPKKVLKALGNSMYTRRTINGIRSETRFSGKEILELLEWLKRTGYASPSGSAYWVLTHKGRETFHRLFHNQA